MDPSSLLQQLETWAKNPPRDILTDEAVRPKLRDAARNLSIAMENPGDTVHRIGFLVIQSPSPFSFVPSCPLSNKAWVVENDVNMLTCG
jgi:hypothetical protein